MPPSWTSSPASPRRPGEPAGVSAFRGVRILDLSQGIAGPMAAMLLGDFEAEILKIEPPGGDRAADEPGYQMWNRNKVRLNADLSTPEGLAEVKRLIAAADVAVFDHAPGVLEDLGLDAATLTAAHPRLIHLWAPPFGTRGEFSDLEAHHGMLTGLTGAAFRQGSYARQPVWHVAPLVHYGQAVVAAGAVGAALYARATSGEGQAVVVSGLHAMSQIAGGIGFADSPGMMQGHPLGGSASFRLYQCGDGRWLFLGALFGHFFQMAIEAMGLNRMRQMPPGIGDVMSLLEHVFAQRPCDEWVEILTAAGVPAASVGEREDWLDSETIAANDMRAELPHPDLGPVVMPGVAAKLAAAPGSVRHLPRDATDAEVAAFTALRTEPRPRGPAPPAPLSGVRVLDMGTVIAGAYAGSILASYGADVVKIEPAEGDPFRPYGTGFMTYNRGKRGLGIDLKSEAGRETFLDLARNADVVLDNWRLGVRERLGLGYEALKAVNPGIISLSITCYGSRGREAGFPGFDPMMQARSGLQSAQGGGPGHEPVHHSIAINDVATAAMASFAVIAALHHRAMTGEGQAVETSLAAQSAMYQAGELTTYAGRPAAALGSPDCLGLTALNRYYPCADGWLTLGCTRTDQFVRLARALDRERWIDAFPDPLAATRDGALAQALEQAFSSQRRDGAIALLRSAGVPAAPVRHAGEAQGDDWLWENGYYEIRHHPGWGDLICSRAFADFGRGQSGFERLHPELGEHGLEVLLDYGVERETIIRLAQSRVIFRG